MAGEAGKVSLLWPERMEQAGCRLEWVLVLACSSLGCCLNGGQVGEKDGGKAEERLTAGGTVDGGWRMEGGREKLDAKTRVEIRIMNEAFLFSFFGLAVLPYM